MITYYNQKDFVKDSLSSVLGQQTDFDFEILIGDDGSNDGTIEEIKSYISDYGDKCTLYVMSRDVSKTYEPIERASLNRLNLLRHAKGEFGIFLDGDDVYSDEYKLQKQVNFLRANEDCIACGHPLEIFGEGVEQGVLLGQISDKSFKIAGKRFWKYYYVSSDSLLFRNVVKVDEIKLTTNFDDNTVLLNYISRGKIGFLPDCMVKYRQTAESSWNKRDELEKLYVNLKDYVEEIQYFPELKRESFIRHLSGIRTLFLSKKNIYSYGKYGEILNKVKMFRVFESYGKKTAIGKLFTNIKYSYILVCDLFVKCSRKFSALRLK